MWFGWNPDEANNPVEFLVTDPPPGCVTVKANWRDNPWFPEVLRTELEYDKRRDPDKYNHVWEGCYRQSSAARVFNNWRKFVFGKKVIKTLAAWSSKRMVVSLGVTKRGFKSCLRLRSKVHFLNFGPTRALSFI